MRRVLILLAFLAAAAFPAARLTGPEPGGELRFSLGAEPKHFNPLVVSEEPEEIVRYLTGGVLLRINRQTQAIEGELAESWRILDAGRQIEFHLRQGVRFSDGSPLTTSDVVFSLRAVIDPSTTSPAGDPFRTGKGPATVSQGGRCRVLVSFPVPMAGLERLFDQVPITSARAVSLASHPAAMPVPGPFRIAEYRPGAYVLLARNPYYWKKDEAGRRLPYLDAVRLSIQQNRDLELLRFLRGEIHLINSLDPESFDRLAARHPEEARDAGRSLESEQMWFNQVARAPIPEYRKEWFRSRDFRLAISQAINRADLARLVYRGRAAPALGPVSPANLAWFNAELRPPTFDPPSAAARLKAAGFTLSGSTLRDRHGNAVEFSLVTNSGNKPRERMSSMIQQDLARIGIRLNVVTLDFGSLIERITRTFDYEACLLGMVNVDLDPGGQMNVWLSSAASHAWNPGQARPETAWEAEIDRLMERQAVEISSARRKALFNRVQQIVVEEAPVLVLVDKNALSAVSSSLANVSPAVLHPQTFWNIDRIYFRSSGP
jgi:peptide/nickel transport system substrate-binding protein